MHRPVPQIHLPARRIEHLHPFTPPGFRGEHHLIDHYAARREPHGQGNKPLVVRDVLIPPEYRPRTQQMHAGGHLAPEYPEDHEVPNLQRTDDLSPDLPVVHTGHHLHLLCRFSACIPHLHQNLHVLACLRNGWGERHALRRYGHIVRQRAHTVRPPRRTSVHLRVGPVLRTISALQSNFLVRPSGPVPYGVHIRRDGIPVSVPKDHRLRRPVRPSALPERAVVYRQNQHVLPQGIVRRGLLQIARIHNQPELPGAERRSLLHRFDAILLRTVPDRPSPQIHRLGLARVEHLHELVVELTPRRIEHHLRQHDRPPGRLSLPD